MASKLRRIQATAIALCECARADPHGEVFISHDRAPADFITRRERIHPGPAEYLYGPRYLLFWREAEAAVIAASLG